VLLVLSVVALCAAVLFAATGGLGRVIASVGSVFGGAIDRITATTTPAPSQLPDFGAPTLIAPAEAYTNQPTVDLTGTVPRGVVGQTNVRLRLYLALKGQDPAPIKEVPAPATTQFTIPGVELTKGTNDFTITIVGPGGESDPSAVVTYVLDTSVPKIALSSPKDGATINRPAVTMTGKTQARSAVVAHNDGNNATATTEAAADGTFSLPIALAAGVNAIQLTATDPAGNAGQLALSVRRGAGKLSVSISASAYRFGVKHLPAQVSLRAVVTNPDGQPLEAVTVTFTLSVPGVPTISADVVTDASGVATFDTTIPKGAAAGLSGPATAFVTTPEFGQTSDRTTITITK
jgi:hypothetical protein